MKILGKNKEQGQSLVEFAITLPIIILILSGLLDLGRAYYTFVALEEAVAEAALYLAISPRCPDDTVGGSECDNPNNAIYRAVNAGNDEFDPTIAEWNIPFTTQKAFDGWKDPFTQQCQTVGCTVLVQVAYPFEILTPGIQNFLANNATTLTLRTQAAQIIVYDQR